jgi:hypothetical protein
MHKTKLMSVQINAVLRANGSTTHLSCRQCKRRALNARCLTAVVESSVTAIMGMKLDEEGGGTS